MLKINSASTASLYPRLVVLWHWLRSSFCFVPSLMVLASILLSYLTVQTDYFLYRNEPARWWLYTGSIEGAREILSSIASSMITVAGVVFSITIVVLSLASSQFGPRLIWNFMHDIGTQIVLGTFISAFVFSILVLGRIRENGEQYFIPQLSVTVGILMSMAGLGVLIYFIHHISASIHANSVAAAVWRDLEDAIDKLFPEKLGHGPEETLSGSDEQGVIGRLEKGCSIPALESGYLEAINPDGLMKIAETRDLLLKVNYRPGHFVVHGSSLAEIYPPDAVDDTLVDEINQTFVLGSQRTPEQDVEFSVNQLVEIAVRALSPGVNDPFTAMTCVDWLGAALCDFLDRKIPSPYRYDQRQRLRIVAPQFTFPGLMDAAFDQIRQNSCSIPGVTIRLLESLAAIAGRVRRVEDIAAVRKHATMVKRGSDGRISEPNDRTDIDARFTRLLQILER